MSRPRAYVRAVCGIRLILAFCGALTLGCEATGGGQPQDRSDPLQSPAFLTPVAQAQDAGVPVYWMGEEFYASRTLFKVSRVAYFIDEMGYGLGLDYSARVGEGGEGAVLTRVQIFADANRAHDAMVTSAGTVGVSAGESVQIGQWRGELFRLPGGPARPTNQLWLFVDLGEAATIVQAFSGSTGVAGTDGNPLIDKDLLIQVVAENLRLYPE